MNIVDIQVKENIWVASQVPEIIRNQLRANTDFLVVDNPDDAMINLQAGSEGEIVAHWVYCLVAAFPTVLDDVSSQDFSDVWQGTSAIYPEQEVFISQTSADLLDMKFGTHAEEKIHIVAEDSISDELWDNRTAWGIVPFEFLTPLLKVISIDSISPLENQFDLEGYSLTFPFSLHGDAIVVEEFLEK